MKKYIFIFVVFSTLLFACSTKEQVVTEVTEDTSVIITSDTVQIDIVEDTQSVTAYVE